MQLTADVTGPTKIGIKFPLLKVDVVIFRVWWSQVFSAIGGRREPYTISYQISFVKSGRRDFWGAVSQLFH